MTIIGTKLAKALLVLNKGDKMNLFTSLKIAIATLSCIVATQSLAQQAPKEKLSVQIKRSASSPMTIVESLTKNILKTESYQDSYIEQVPYQETETYQIEVPYQTTETYTEQVPYQDTETYTEQVPYQDTETYLENVAYEVQVPYTETVTEYRQEYKCSNETKYRREQQCQNVTRYRQDCHTEQQCYIVPGTGGGQQCQIVEECGTNAQGQRICKKRNVCTDSSDGSGPQQKCENKQVCESTPYTDNVCSYVDVPYIENVCNYVSVPYQTQVTKYRTETQYRQEQKTRAITRYRNETRTRAVTKYKTETRSRTVTKMRLEDRTRQVTKYRDEEKCCVTKTREVFDRQLSYNVSVVFPQNAILNANESETLNIKLVQAGLNNASVQLEILNSIYGYKIASQNLNGAGIDVVLVMIPKLDLSNAGPVTIQNLKINFLSQNQKFEISFSDVLNSSRTQTDYEISLYDLQNNALIETLPVTQLSSGLLGAINTANLDSEAKFKVVLKVTRSGILISGAQIQFESVVNYERRTLQKSDLLSLSDKKNLGGLVSGQGLDSGLLVSDLTSDFADVETTYAIYLTAKKSDGSSLTLATTVISRAALKQQGQVLKLKNLVKVSSDVAKVLQKGKKIAFTIQAARKSSSSLLNGKSATVSVDGSIIIQ